jgi:hypothetical protein
VEFPHIQALYDELKSQGLEIIAFTGSTAPDSAQRWIDHNKVTIPLLLAEYDDEAGAFANYKAANGIYYVVDPKGTIVYAGNYDMSAIIEALRKLGFK